MLALLLREFVAGQYLSVHSDEFGTTFSLLVLHRFRPTGSSFTR